MYTVFLTKYSSENAPVLDRGDYVLIIRGSVYGEERELVSTVLTLDVGGCELTNSAFNAPYGVLRSREACLARGAEVDHESGEYVCCALEMVTAAISKKRAPDSQSPRAPTLGALEFRGRTSFWGSPLTVRVKEALRSSQSPQAEATGPAPFRIYSSSGYEFAEPAVAFSLDPAVGSTATFTPKIAFPDTYIFTTGPGLHPFFFAAHDAR